MSSSVVLPETYQHADKGALITLVYEVLAKVIEYNDKITASIAKPSKLTRFHSQTSPNISVLDYLHRIVKYTALEPVCLLMILLYADRIAANSSKNSFILCSLTIHRFLITAVCVASKAICDVYCTNSHYAKVGGISPRELALLEMTIIEALSWHLATSNETLTLYYKSLVENHPTFVFPSTPNSNTNSNTNSNSKSDSKPTHPSAPTLFSIPKSNSSSSSNLPALPSSSPRALKRKAVDNPPSASSPSTTPDKHCENYHVEETRS